MKKFLFICWVILGSGIILNAQVSVSGSNGKDGSYSSLTKAGGAFAALNSLTQAGRTITITITGDVTTEDGTNFLTGAAGMWNSLTIVPSGNRTISGSHGPSGLIELSGVMNVKIDGKNNGTNSLIIENTSTSGQTIRLIAGAIGAAYNDTVVNCSIKGCSTSWGVISFWELNTSTANNNNFLGYCDIGPSGSNHPLCGIYSYATTNYNNGVTITGNNFHDFIGAGNNGWGIYIMTNGGSNLTISNNSFYLTSAVRASTTATHGGIRIFNSGSVNCSITGNYIGGSAPNCGGTAWVDTTTNQTAMFEGIRLNVGTSSASYVENNTIRNILFRANTSSFTGISVTGGLVNIGETAGNTISQVTISSVCQGGTYGFAYGIYDVSSSSSTIANNNINGITVQSYSGGTNSSFTGIYAAGPSTVSNNTISGETNSITSDQSGGQLTGIYTEYANVITVTGNTVRDFQHSGAETGSGASASIIGMRLAATSAGQTAYGNSIFNLANTNATSAGIVEGIYYSGPTSGTNNVYGNWIYSLTTASSNTNSAVFGIYIAAGSTNFYNNMISVGAGITTDNTIEGIYENGSALSSNILYYNSVNISGTSPAGASVNTFAFYNNANTDTRNFRDNIFQNGRSNTSGTAKHYAISLSGNTSLTIDYNDYYVSGTGGVLGRFSGADKTTLAAWQAATGQDSHSKNVTAPYVSTTDLHIPPGTVTTIANGGFRIIGYNTDYDGQTRSVTSPDIGADEFHEFIILVAGSNGKNGYYTSLSRSDGVFAALNSTSQSGHNITVTIYYDVTNEDGTTALNGSNGMWNSLLIIPSGQRTISGSVTGGGMISLVVARYVKINGKNDGVNSLTIENTNAGGYTLYFFALTNGKDATSDTVVNCTLKGCSSDHGVICFYGPNLSPTSKDYIGYCDIGPSGSNHPSSCIWSGAGPGNNDGITIVGNHIHDFISPGTGGYGIYFNIPGGGSGAHSCSNWYISGNSFYLTSPVTETTGTIHCPVYLNSVDSHGTSVTGNYIGGSAPDCGGTPWVDTSFNQSVTFYGMFIADANNPTDAFTVENNTIGNILFRAKNSSFSAIDINDGMVNVGDVSGNTISNITILSPYQTGGNGPAYGICDVSSYACTISNNVLSGITVQSASGTGTSFTGIYTAGPATITNNDIGSNVSNSISCDQSSGQLIGINTSGSADATVSGNQVRNLTHIGQNTGSGSAASVIGLSLQASGNQTIGNNTISSLVCSYAVGSVSIEGIYYSGSTSGTNTVSGNYIYGNSISSASTGASLYGLFIASGATSFYNNMIALGTGTTHDNIIAGIYENGASGDNNMLYFNSVNVTGTAPASAATNTYALLSNTDLSTRDFRNNIFQNARSNTSGAARHYAVKVAGNTALTIDYNDYSASGTGGLLGNYAGTDKSSISLWQAATGQDSHSKNVTAPFVSATDLHIPVGTVTSLASGGTPISGITTDYDGESRNASNPDPGADEFQPMNDTWTGTTNTDWNTTTNWNPSIVPIDRTNVIIPNVTNQPIISTTGNKCLNVTIQNGATLHVNPGKNLTIGGNITLQP
jgi:hypothetical protein